MHFDTFSSKNGRIGFAASNCCCDGSDVRACRSFTGKERDEETGYGYFGARYMDHELLTMWLSVDPMADKYPGISPYAYCAWNPVKLIDPDGNEINVSALSLGMQKRLCNCLGTITGLNLSVNKNGRLVSSGEREGSSIFSQSAREDLLKAINDNNVVVDVSSSKDGFLKGDWAFPETQEILLGEHEKQYDNSTEGLGMMFMHELGHAYFGDEDPTYNHDNNSFVWDVQSGYCTPIPNPSLCLGDAVTRVNRYRSEMNMPIRISYESMDYNKYSDHACWQSYDGKVAFRSGSGEIEYKFLR